ncbi:hypothetical protein IFO70_21125 [Phormidium tenue FACHB-886]|nr:hypothetical protein [Phormidium tenue FACHB-886]
MQNFPSLTPSSSLRAILNPPDLLSGTPGEGVSLGVVVQNAGDRGAIIDVFINEDSDSAVLQWCRVTRQRLALDPQQKEELVFNFTLPATAAAATYDYILVLDAPEGYPEEPPLQYPLQLRVLFKEQTTIRANDPTFFISPATNPQKPAPLHPGTVLQFQVRVDNRSNNVDNYRLSCPDLEEEWFEIRYPKSNLGEFGLVIDSHSLDLNPRTQGIIQLDIFPPAEALAGVYIPSIYLHSVNLPDLRRLDCVYFEIQRVETLDVELVTLIGRISHTAGQYRLNLKNTGNVVRQLRFSANSRDEDEICTYRFDPPNVRLLPNQTAQVLLLVTPNQPKQRPFWGMGQTINFQVALHDADGYQILDRPPQGTLTWKARPWWQLLLLVLLGLGLLAGGVLLVRWLLKPDPPPEVAGFKAIDGGHEEGEPVQLEWVVRHPKNVQSMVITATPPIQPAEISVAPSQCLSDSAQNEQIRCKESVGALSAQKYEFVLNTVLQNGQSLSSKAEVVIAPKAPPNITAFNSTKTSYQRSEPIQFSWTIDNSDQLNGLTLIATDTQNQSNINIPLLRSKTGQGIRSKNDIQPEAGMPDLQAICKLSETGVLTCAPVPISLNRASNYTFKLQASVLQPQGASPRPAVESQPTGTVTLEPRSLTLQVFLNGDPNPPPTLFLKPEDNKPLLVEWQATGENVQVSVQNNTKPGEGFLSLPSPLPGQSFTISVKAADETERQPIETSITVIKLAPSPTPTPIPTPIPTSTPSPASSPAVSP